MANPLTSDLEELCPDTVTITPGYLDWKGAFIPSGSVIVAENCRINQRNRLVRNVAGQEVVSSLKITIMETHNLNVHGFRFTLPDRYDPYENLEALSVRQSTDENGPHHEVVWLP